MISTIVVLYGLGCYVLGLLTVAFIVWDRNRSKTKEQ